MTNIIRLNIREISLVPPSTSPVAFLKFLLEIIVIELPATKADIIIMIPVNLRVKNPKMKEITRDASKNFKFIFEMKKRPVPSSKGSEKVAQVTNPSLAVTSDKNMAGNMYVPGMEAIAANVINETVKSAPSPPVPILLSRIAFILLSGDP